VLTPAQAKQAKDCGAAFAVAPGFNPEVVKAAQAVGLPFFPGVMTPSDVEGALAIGCTILKFFPAAQAGGPAMLSALSGPYAHTGLRFMPTGGITPANLHEYLAVKTVVAAGGTWIAKTEAIRDGQWDAIAENARQVSALLKTLGRR
jgi:2-dehydro-3-deoxyphosphogluconate aldolase/(4S)-4-hydroxy-2-oxoglutarate aldolase